MGCYDAGGAKPAGADSAVSGKFLKSSLFMEVRGSPADAAFLAINISGYLGYNIF